MVVLVGNPGLKPQTSDNYTLGVVLTPPQVKGLTLSVDYYRIEIKNLSIQDPQYILNTFSPGDINPITGHPYISLGAGNRVVGVEVPWLNLGGLNTDGLDFGGMYVLPTDSCGKFTFAGDANYTLTWEQQSLPGQPFVSHLAQDDTAQLFGALPRFKAVLSATWEYQDFAFTPAVHYTGGFRDMAAANQVPDYWTVDLQATYNWKKAHTKFTVGVLNVADADLPKDYAPGASNGNLYSRNLYDIRQRFWYVSANVTF